MKNVFAAIGLVLACQSFAEAQTSLPPVRTASFVDLAQYLGKWYEIAAIPQSFEKQCVRNTTAEYANAENNLISVKNSCDTESGKPSVANGRGKVSDPTSNAKLRVTFVNFFGWQFIFGGDYWILSVGENYSYAVVGAPGRDYAWILSRTPSMTIEQMRAANQTLVQQGFDSCKLLSTVQDSGLQEKTPLCQLTGTAPTSP